MFTISITTDNASFGETADSRNNELSRILKGIAEDIENDPSIESLVIRDINGNAVGDCYIS